MFSTLDLKKIIGLLLLILALFAGYWVLKQKQNSTPIQTVKGSLQTIKEYDLSSLNQQLKENFLTVDLVIIHNQKAKITWKELKEEFLEARKLFFSYGVQLHLLKALLVSFPDNWNGIPTTVLGKKPTDDLDLDFYDLIEYGKRTLPKVTEDIFNQFIPKTANAHRTVYIVTLSDLVVSWFEKNSDNEWVKVESKTSAISFPPYILADRVPKHLRGIISFQTSKLNKKTMAHELGHKLINVSHEGLNHCPKGDGKTIPGLMGYGKSKKIFGGRKGRWHKERLLKSPFLYRLEKGEKRWNPEYLKGGVYNDPIYGDYIVKPACPKNKKQQ